MKNATDKLHDRIRREIETGRNTYAETLGGDWFNISREEAAVFELSLDELPSLVTVWTAYEHMLDIAGEWEIPADVVEGVLAEHPWLSARRATRTVGHDDFVKFAKLFGVPYRKSLAWYWKHDFWLTRAGVTLFADEESIHLPRLSGR